MANTAAAAKDAEHAVSDGVDDVVRLGAGEVLTLQHAAYVTEAQAHADLNLPPLRQSLPEVAAELDDPHVLDLGWRDVHGRLIAAVRARLIGRDAAVAEIGPPLAGKCTAERSRNSGVIGQRRPRPGSTAGWAIRRLLQGRTHVVSCLLGLLPMSCLNLSFNAGYVGAFAFAAARNREL